MNKAGKKKVKVKKLAVKYFRGGFVEAYSNFVRQARKREAEVKDEIT